MLSVRSEVGNEQEKFQFFKSHQNKHLTAEVTSLAFYEILAVVPKVVRGLLEAFYHTDIDKTKRLNELG